MSDEELDDVNIDSKPELKRANTSNVEQKHWI